MIHEQPQTIDHKIIGRLDRLAYEVSHSTTQYMKDSGIMMTRDYLRQHTEEKYLEFYTDLFLDTLTVYDFNVANVGSFQRR